MLGIQRGNEMIKYINIRNIFKNTILILTLFPFIHGMPQESIPEGLEQRIEQIRKDWDIPGMSVAIIKDDKVIYAKGFGVRELGKPAKVNKKTLFAVASTTKAMTVATLGMLVDEEKLSWDDWVVDILPGFRMYDAYATAEMRVRDLLTHKSGLSRGDGVWLEFPITQKKVLHQIRYLKPAYSFRSKYHYSNLMYLTAGLLSAEVHGDSWDKVMYKRLFKPLKMNRSVPMSRDIKKRNNVATPHAKENGLLSEENFKTIKHRDADAIAPAAAVYSNALEMANWVRLNMNKGEFEGKRILSEAVINEMHKPQMHLDFSPRFPEEAKVTNFKTYGLGWSIDDYRGYKRVSHGGYLDGFSTWIGFLPANNLGWVVMNNGGARITTVVGAEIIDAFLGVKDRVDWSVAEMKYVKANPSSGYQISDSLMADLVSSRVEGTHLRLKYSGYIGNYTHEFYGKLKIEEKDGKLIISRGENLMGTLNHWHYDTFRVRWDLLADRVIGCCGGVNEFITFHFNVNNEANAMERVMDGRPTYFTKSKKEA